MGPEETDYQKGEKWGANIHGLNERQLYAQATPLHMRARASSDDSSAHITVDGKLHVTHKNFPDDEIVRSSTWREHDAVLHAVLRFTPLIRGKDVVWETDNHAVPTITQKGSRKADRHNLAVNLYYTCRSTGVDLNCKWIPREENHLADQISKCVDYDAWKTTAELFQLLDYEWGPHSIDRFANATNTKTRRFNSQYWNPACEAVDAFTQNWADNINWLVPPVYLVSKAIRHAEGC